MIHSDYVLTTMNSTETIIESNYSGGNLISPVNLEAVISKLK